MKIYIFLSPNHDMVPHFTFHRYADPLVEAYARELHACDVIKNMLSREFLFYAQKKKKAWFLGDCHSERGYSSEKMPFLETDFKLRDEYSFVKFKDFIIKNHKNNMDIVMNGALHTQDWLQDKLSDFVMLKEKFKIDIRIFYVIGNSVESCGSVIKLFNCFERWGTHLPTNFILADFAGQKREFYDFSLQKYFKAQMRKYGSREHFLGKIDKEWVEFSESWEIPPKENDFVTTQLLAPKLWRDEIFNHVVQSCWQPLCPVEAQWARLEI